MNGGHFVGFRLPEYDYVKLRSYFRPIDALLLLGGGRVV